MGPSFASKSEKYCSGPIVGLVPTRKEKTWSPIHRRAPILFGFFLRILIADVHQDNSKRGKQIASFRVNLTIEPNNKKKKFFCFPLAMNVFFFLYTT